MNEAKITFDDGKVLTVKGAKGDKGDSGERGDIGPSGLNGSDGRDGATGPRGPKGNTGEDGKDGEKGDKGDAGKDGENPDIKDLIKEIKKGKYIEKRDIKGFDMNDQRWHGGGSGGLNTVSHDDTLTGTGTPSSPLSVVDSGVFVPYVGATAILDMSPNYGVHAGVSYFTDPSGEAPVNLVDVNGSVATFQMGFMTTSHDYSFPDKSGTIALLSDTENFWTLNGSNNIYNNNPGTRVGVNNNTPVGQLDVISQDSTIADPSGLSVSLVPESLIGAPSDSPNLIYGPQATTGFGTENPGYSGYFANDSVDAFIYPYRFIEGVYWTAAAGSLGNVTLSSNPSGIDWSWSGAVNGDGSGVDGYIINIIDNTEGTNYSYDVGNTTNYADMNVGGTVSYQDFASAGAFTASAQSFNFEPYNVATSPSGFGTYASQSGGDFGISDGQNNGTYFWVQHNLSGNSGTGWSRVFLLDTVAGNSGETSLSTYYQRSSFGGPGALPYSQHYGFLSDGSFFNQSFAAYAQETSPSIYYSSGFSTFSLFDPNDGQYYILDFSISSIGGGNSTRIVRQDGYHLDASTYPFLEDAFGPNFSTPPSNVTPIGLTNSAVIAQNSAGLYDQPPALKIVSTNGAATAVFYDNSTEKMRLGYDPASVSNYVKSPSGAFEFRNTNNVVLASIKTSSAVFNNPQTSAWSFLIKTPNANPIFAVFGNTDSIAIGPSANTSAWINIAAGSTSKSQFNFATSSSIPSSTAGGAFNFNGSYLTLDNSTFRARILQTGTASQLTSGVFPISNASGNLVDSSLSLVGGFGGTVIQSSLQFEAKQGIQLDSGKDIIMGSGSRVTGNIGWTYVAKTANFTLGINEYVYNATSNSFNFTLPTAVSISGREYQIHNSGTGTTTILTTSSQTIDGNASGAITLTQYQSLTVVSDGANWIITSRNLLSNTGILPIINGGTGQSTPVVKAGSFSGVGAATTTFTVTIGTTQANTTYKVNVTPTDLLAAAVFYVNNKTTTTFDVVYLAGLTGTVTFDWALFT